MANRFQGAENVSQLVAQLVGAGSTCWVGGTGSAPFDTDEAKRFTDEGVERLVELGWA